MSQLLGLLSPLGFGQGGLVRQDDDLVDHLSHTYTVLLMVVFALVISTKQFVGDPIQCWMPSSFSGDPAGAYNDYINKVCWVSNTYYLPFEDRVKTPGESRHHIVYYQWVPMILIFQAVLFYLPSLLWKMMNSRSGVDVNNLVEAAHTMQEGEGRDKTLTYIVRNMARFLVSFRDREPKTCIGHAKAFLSEKCHFFCGRKYGNYLVALQMFIKFLYLANTIAQVFLLNAFLGTEYHMYGLDVIRHLAMGDEWAGSDRFPRVTMCDFQVRQMGNVHAYTVQCVLPINLFNEKIFLAVWFWLVLLSLITCLWFLVTFIQGFFKNSRATFIKRHLKFAGKLQHANDTKNMTIFVNDYLRADGVLVLRIINLNTNNLVTSEIIGDLWDSFLANPPRCLSCRPLTITDNTTVV